MCRPIWEIFAAGSKRPRANFRMSMAIHKQSACNESYEEYLGRKFREHTQVKLSYVKSFDNISTHFWDPLATAHMYIELFRK